MRVRIPIDSKATRAYMSRVGKKQIPFATARALTMTAKDVASACGTELGRYIDRPTPFTKRGFGIIRATKSRLQAYVIIKDIQAEYMQYQIKGGSRHPKRRAIPIPVAARRNAYGNMTKGAITKLMSDPNMVSGNFNGVEGIWDRRTGRLMVSWKKSAKYRSRYPFGRRVRVHARQRYAPNFRKAFADAMRTAR